MKILLNEFKLAHGKGPGEAHPSGEDWVFRTLPQVRRVRGPVTEILVGEDIDMRFPGTSYSAALKSLRARIIRLGFDVNKVQIRLLP